MNELNRKLIFNPVIGLPWKTETQFCENTASFVSSFQKEHKTDNIRKLRQRNQNQNVDLLITRFPGLKKYQAKAALTMSDNKLEKAIILLEVSHCYRREIAKTNTELAYLKNIHINLCYDLKRQDPTLRNVIFESSFSAENKTADLVDEERRNGSTYGSDARDEKDSDVPKIKRVGVVIAKTIHGYKATPFW